MLKGFYSGTLVAGALLSCIATSEQLNAQPRATSAVATERFGIPLKFGTLDKMNSTLLGGPAVAVQIERTGDPADPLRLRVTMRSLPPKGQIDAPASAFTIEADGASVIQVGAVSGVRQFDDPASPSPVATDVYVFPLAKGEANQLVAANTLLIRARGKKVDIDGRRLAQNRPTLQSLLAAADAGVPVSGSSAEPVRAATAAPASLPSQSSTIVVLQSRVLGGAGAASAQVRGDSSIRRTLVTTACGTSRLCSPGWDLRIARLAVDDSAFAPGGFLQGRLTIENRGSTRTDLSEVRLCIASGIQCIGEPSSVTIPALASGEKMDVAQPVAAYGGGDVSPPYSLLAIIDPERATGESNRSNNEAVIRNVTLDTASLAVDAFEVPSALRANPTQVQVSLVIRNASRVASSTVRALQVGGVCNYDYGWGDVATRIQIPALSPSQSWSATIGVRHPRALATATTGETPCELRLNILQSTRPEEKERLESRISRPYKIGRQQ